MSSSMWYFNLLIDSQWDESGSVQKLFPVKPPRSQALANSYSNLGVYLAKPEDYFFWSGEFDTFSFLVLKDLKDKITQNLIFIPGDAKEETILDVVKFSLGKAQQQVKQLKYCALSLREQKVLVASGLKAPEKIELEVFKSWNNKLHNFSLLKDYFPKTRVESFDSSRKEDLISAKHIVKLAWGSGGGSVFPATLDSFRFLHRMGYEPPFLWQEKILSDKEYSLCYSRETKSYALFLVFYDKNGLSYFHKQVDIPRDLWEFVEPISKELPDTNWGLDLILSKSGEFYLLDINLRYTKSHCFAKLSELLKELQWEEPEFLRLRFNKVTRDKKSQFMSLLESTLNQFTRSSAVKQTVIHEFGLSSCEKGDWEITIALDQSGSEAPDKIKQNFEEAGFVLKSF